MIYQLENVGLQRGEKKILQSVSFSISQGTLTFITGLNGSGKSTLLQALSKMLPYSGSILFCGKSLDDWMSTEFSQKLAIIQQLQTLPFSFSVREFILLGRFAHLGFWGNYQEADYQALEKYASITGITSFLDRSLPSLSGGELQKVYITQALVQETDVLLLDEPSRFLDPLNRMELYRLLESLAISGKTILCVSHDSEIFEIQNAEFIGIHSGEIILAGNLSGNTISDFRKNIYNL